MNWKYIYNVEMQAQAIKDSCGLDEDTSKMFARIIVWANISDFILIPIWMIVLAGHPDFAKDLIQAEIYLFISRLAIYFYLLNLADNNIWP